uniref:Helicase ATP-binding domain-containing protein n=1 Tax=viral metagenome TaxID=1070528 RepID=A0A6C0KIK6_9ZZZZ
MENSYLGKKGYSIHKNNLTQKQLTKIKKDLTVKAFIPKSSIGEAKPFPIYRESKNKLYVPRFYGINEFGIPKESKINSSKDIKLTFTSQLYPHQVPVVEQYLNHVNNHGCGCGLLDLYCGYGKTVVALNIISKLKKKTLIIVHKEFLLNQWVERITQFLPDANIGKIQGQTIDTENKDIVIGMLQSLSMKEYPSSLFDDFGFTIIDETHHISAEVFSNALFKVVTQYMLGLSATMNRKDGLTKVFKLFLGDIVVSKKRVNEHPVIVQGIEYNVNDEFFNETVYNFKGQTHYALMISKLCEFNPRREFILSILQNTLKQANKDDQTIQIMILAHNRNLLMYLYDAIEHRKIATVGYYLGGMKEKDLKASESKQVIVATYAMAEEALDIKTLTTLIMATPKTDVTQAVGRILRDKNNKHPLVMDIIDPHVIFRKQWMKRKKFYMKNNYKIIYSADYKNNIWETIWDDKKKNAKSKNKNSTHGDFKDDNSKFLNKICLIED